MSSPLRFTARRRGSRVMRERAAGTLEAERRIHRMKTHGESSPYHKKQNGELSPDHIKQNGELSPNHMKTPLPKGSGVLSYKID